MTKPEKIALGLGAAAGATLIGYGIYKALKPPPVAENFVVSDLVIEPAQIYPGEGVNIRVTVTNIGPTPETGTITLEVF